MPDDKWALIRDYYARTQRTDPESKLAGYWSYHNVNMGDRGQSFTMSVAGVCGLIIAGMGLDASQQRLDEATGVAANCGVYAENAAVAKGLNWVAAHFNFESPSAKSLYYNVYGLERLGRLSGQRFVGQHDWYREGCEFLVRNQRPDGGFSKGTSIDFPMTSAAFALLFLSKGRSPVLVSKFAWGDFKDRGNGTFLEIGGDPDKGIVNWNRKHNDVRHLVEYAGRELFKGEPLSWQAYDVRRQKQLAGKADEILAEVGTLVQSPVVYLNGHTSPARWMTDVQKEILKRYVEEGGFILAEACCGDEEFARGFRELMEELFPENRLRKMPPEHAVWRSFADVSPADFPDLECLERGCKTVAVFSPRPLAGYWEEHRFMPEKGKAAKNPGERAFRLAGNVIAYATGLELPKPKLTVARLPQAKDDAHATRSYFQAAQLKIQGEAEPAPAAMRNLMAYLKDRAGLEVRLEKKSLSPGDDSLFGFKFMYLHGRKAFKFDDFERDNLRSNLQTGGLLLADACCGKAEFDKSFREMAAQLFPESKLQVIPAADALYSAKLNGGTAIGTVRCRRENKDGTPEPEMRNFSPYLEGIRIDGRWAVVYSRYDLGFALEGHKSSDCLGHDKESALRLGAAAVLYALKRRAPYQPSLARSCSNPPARAASSVG